MKILTTLIAGLASGETAAALRRARLAAIAYLVAGTAALCGVGFLIGAAYIWVAARYGPVVAALSFGIGFLVLAGLIVLVFRLSGGSRARRRARRRKNDVTAIAMAAALAAAPTLLRGKGGLGLLIGPAVALAAYAIYRENARPAPRDPERDPDR